MNIKLSKRSGITQSQTLLITEVVFLVLFVLIAVPFYNSYKKKETIVKLKTVYSLLSQANRTYSLIASSNMDAYDTTLDAGDFAGKYFMPYLPDSWECSDSQDACWNKVQYTDLAGKKYINKVNYSIILQNNTVLGFNKDKYGLISLLVDVDGKSGKNKLGRDIFVFSFYNHENPPKICENIPSKDTYIKDGMHFGGYDKCGIPFDVYTYQDLYSKTMENGCNKKSPGIAGSIGVGSACMALVYKSNWAIDKIYPW